MMLSSANSQQPSTDSTVIVPVKALRNALLVKAERDDLKNQLVVARDSISTMDTIIFRREETIHVLDSTRIVLDGKVEDYKGVVTAKDGIIQEQKDQIQKLKAIVITTSLSIVSLLLVLL